MELDMKLKKAALGTALDYIAKDPERNIHKLMNWVDKFTADDPENLASQRNAVRKVLDEPDSNMYKLIMNIFHDVDTDVIKKVFENFIVNANLIGFPREAELSRQYGCNVPWAILMDPTTACNLRCMGCWAADYGKSLSMSYDELSGIIRQGKELGIYMYLFSGGEPLTRKADIIRLCEEHNDCQFLAFTNGTLIDTDFAREMLRVKNFIPAISVEGFEAATDARRGEGTYQAVMAAMARLKAYKLPFGISCCYTSQNIDSLSSEEFFDHIIDCGAKFAWFFHYMPVGVDAVTELLPRPEQREHMYRKIREYRQTKPIFSIDFQNDGEYVGGCIAGGRSYLHISAGGDIEPCAFIHYSDSNIREKTLLEALRSPLFMAYHDNQPFNCNHLRPCPMLENPDRLAKMVKDSGAHSTDMQSPEDAEHLREKCTPYAEAWAPEADKLWKESHK
ncbi:MAG: radical SAM protein [Candidatus Scatomorpha sp.]|jgi:MoaA/NifB/PqqE/SkfB family radical SAM enzyme